MMYGLYTRDGMVVGYHERKDVLREYGRQLNIHNLYIVKVKKKKISETNDLYLVRYGGGWIPSMLYEDATIITDEERYEYERITDIISRELEFEKLSSSDRKALEKTYLYFREKVEEINEEIPDIKQIQNCRDLRQQWDHSVYKDDPFDDF